MNAGSVPISLQQIQENDWKNGPNKQSIKGVAIYCAHNGALITSSVAHVLSGALCRVC